MVSAEQLKTPWLPPTAPWWTLGGRWAKDETIPKKTLVFSRFQAVPQAIASMMSYQENGAILRKDIDRYDDAIVDAHGEVPRAVIEYVEEAFSELKYARFSVRASATRAGIKLLAEDD